MTRVAYLTSAYPHVSHLFILREVIALREDGIDVHTFTLHRTPDEGLFTDVDRAERDRTYAIQPVRWGRLVVDHLRALVTKPTAYVRTLTGSLWLGRGARGRLWQLFYFAEAIALWAEMRRRGLRHVHVVFANPAADVAMLAAEFGGNDWRWSLTLHGPAEFFEETGNHLREKLESAAFIVCGSYWGMSQGMSIAPPEVWPRFTLVRGGVDLTLHQPRTSPPRDRVEILSVGRLAPVKGQLVLVDALARVRDEGIPFRCRIVGDGPVRGALERRVAELGLEEVVELPGSVGMVELRELYADTDIFCLPSFREGLPTVLIESLAMERAVVATRIVGVPELITDGESGLLVTPASVDELADALVRAARDPELRRRLGAAGRKVVEREYELSRQARQMAALFAGGHPPASR